MSTKLISIVVPVLNEEKNVSLLYQELQKVFQNLSYSFEVLYVDDGSTDGSVEAIEELRSQHPNVFYLSFSRNFGHQFALTAGLDHARGDAVITMDSDLQHPPQLIPEILKQWEEGFDIVYTLRKQTHGAGFTKRLTSHLYYQFFRISTGLNIPNGIADFRLFDRAVVETFKNIRERTRLLRGLTYWVGFRSVGIEYTAQPRKHGVTKYNFTRMFTLALDGISSFSTKPLVLSSIMGFVMAFSGGAYLLYVIWIKIFHSENTIAGWASVLSVILLTMGAQLIFLGLIGLYLGKIYEEVKGRPLYILRKKAL